MKKQLLSLVILSIIGALPLAVQSQIYVDLAATGSNNGTSWKNAYTNLQTAIDGAKSTDTIWVTSGNYYPSKVTNTQDNRSKTFLLTKTFAMYGGFAGTETNLKQRSLKANTTLSGDINNKKDSTDNAYHVLLSLANGTIDGFNITNGNANGIGDDTINSSYIPRNIGGALYTKNSTIYAHNCTIENNAATEGGAGFYLENVKGTIENSQFTSNISTGIDDGLGGGSGILITNNSNLTLTSVTFKENKSIGCIGGGALKCEDSYSLLKEVEFASNFSSNGDGGGAIYNLNSNSSLTKVLFESNTTENEGGAMYNDGSIPTMENVSFLNNSCGSDGGGAMENDGGSNAIIKNSIFKGNSSLGDGGAIQNWKSSIVLTDVSFLNNTADGNGGAILNYNECSPIMTNVKFIKNTAKNNGGGLYSSRKSDPIITNSLFAYNHAGQSGGGIYNFSHSSPTGAGSSPILTNVTIANNTAGTSGGGAFTDAEGSPQIRNCIISGNYAPSDPEVDAPNAVLAGAIFNDLVGDEFMQNAFSTPIAIPVNHLLFEDSANLNYRLSMNSMALDRGDSSFFNPLYTPNISAATHDLAGMKRIMGSNIDLGAYESCDAALVASTAVTIKGNKNLYYGDTILFSTTSINGGKAATYKWYINSVLKQSGSTSTFTVKEGIDFMDKDMVTVVMFSSEVCAIDSVANTVLMKVTCDPAIVSSTKVDLSLSKKLIYGDTAHFATTAINGGNSATYNWYVNGILVKTGKDSSFTAIAGEDLHNSDKVSVAMFSSNLCAIDSVHDEIVVQIYCDSLIVASTAVNVLFTPNKEIHFEDVVAFNATSVNQGDNPTYHWYINQVMVKFGADSTYSGIAGTDFTNGDTVSVKMLSSNLCAITTVSDMVVMKVTCDSLLVSSTSVTVSYAPDSMPRKGDVLLFTAHSSNQGDSAIYNWYVNENLVKTGYDTTFTAVAGTDFENLDTVSVTMLSSNFCALASVSDSKVLEINTTGFQNNFNKNTFTLYPNPNTGRFNIQGYTVSGSGLKLEIVNISGQKVYEKQIPITVNLSDGIEIEGELQSGIYFLRIIGNKEISMRKFVVITE